VNENETGLKSDAPEWPPADIGTICHRENSTDMHDPLPSTARTEERRVPGALSRLRRGPDGPGLWNDEDPGETEGDLGHGCFRA